MPKKLFLALNAGSSSLKFALFGEDGRVLARGLVERIGKPDCFLSMDGGRVVLVGADHAAALVAVLGRLPMAKDIGTVAHRIVHGGEDFDEPVRLTASVLKKIESLNPYAPLHNPVNLTVVLAARRALPRAAHFGVFDTAPFVDLPAVAQLYALPRQLARQHGIRKYGFHGTSHVWAAQHAAAELKKPLRTLRLITVHLGSGCSMTAFSGGKPVETSMGFSPLVGLVMGTRPGDIDPMVVQFLRDHAGLDDAGVERVLWKESGLLGLSGFNDMREILAAAGHRVSGWNPTRRYTVAQRRDASEALEKFIYSIRWYLSAYAGVLGRVDAVVFTGGVGERSAVVRQLVMRGLTPTRGARVLVVPADEEAAMRGLVLGK